MLAAVQSELFLIGLRSSSLDLLVSSEKKPILSVDYDWHEQRVYWITLNADSIKWSSFDKKNTGTIIKGLSSECGQTGLRNSNSCDVVYPFLPELPGDFTNWLINLNEGCSDTFCTLKSCVYMASVFINTML